MFGLRQRYPGHSRAYICAHARRYRSAPLAFVDDVRTARYDGVHSCTSHLACGLCFTDHCTRRARTLVVQVGMATLERIWRNGNVTCPSQPDHLN